MNALTTKSFYFLFRRKVFPYPLAVANFSIRCLICFIATLNCNWISSLSILNPVAVTPFSAMCNITILMKRSNYLLDIMMTGFIPVIGTANIQPNRINEPVAYSFNVLFNGWLRASWNHYMYFRLVSNFLRITQSEMV